MGIGAVYIYNQIKRELKRTNREIEIQAKITVDKIQDTHEKIKDTNEKVDLLFSKIDNSNSDIADIKSNIATITEAILWMKQYSWKGHK